MEKEKTGSSKEPDKDLLDLLDSYEKFRFLSPGCTFSRHIKEVMVFLEKTTKVRPKRVLVALAGAKAEFDFLGFSEEIKDAVFAKSAQWLVPQSPVFNKRKKRKEKEMKIAQALLEHLHKKHFLRST